MSKGIQVNIYYEFWEKCLCTGR